MNEKCFALRRSGRCGALTSPFCTGYATCPFYKPKWMHERDTERTNRKLSALPLEEQLYIASKYYRGWMPWKGERV
ncbi:MAG: hypothetical protein IKJ26_04955 [Clostridia bacterium]|nr:hypothetical protein [Clostridia bacterium]